MIDVVEQINAVQRTVGTRTLAAGEARTVVITRTYNAAVEDIWDACTNVERIPRWFLPITGDLRVGGRYQLEGNAGGIVESCNPPHAFSATWEYGTEISWIEVRLQDDPNGALLTLEHIAHVDDERWAEYGPGAVGVGWDLAIIGLSLHLASGAPVDPQEVMSWSMSDEGRQFMTLSSQQWCDASMSAGTDPAAAGAAAERTTAFYTGVPVADATAT